MFLVSFLVLNTADNPRQLGNNIFQAGSIAQKYNCQLTRLDFQQEEGLMSCLPLGLNQIEIQRGLPTSSTAIFVPFTTQELFQNGKEALYYGINALSNNLIMVDRKLLKNPNGLILGTPGSGKSFSAKREIANCFLLTSDDVIICDPEAEYAPLVERLHGQVIKISPTSTNYINPMDLNLDYSDDESPLSLKSDFILSLYNKVNMLLKCIFYAAERNQILEHNPCAGISGKGGKPSKKREALTDQQVAVLLDTVKGLPPYLFIMLGLYSGLRREEILALKWDCVFLDEDTPYLSVRRAWRTEHNRPVVSTVLKTPAAKRDIPIPKCLVDCLREAKENSISDYVIADSKGEPLAASQFQRVWQYVVVRSTKPRNYYKYVNGQSIKYTVTPTLGMTQKNQPKIRYTLDFDVTPHQLRHTYITNLLYAGVDPKTVQYLAGHENSKTTMDIYAKVKYNKPEELFGVVNGAFHQAIAE